MTEEGERFRETAVRTLRDIYQDRDAFRRDLSKTHADLWISGSTALLVHFLPGWLDGVYREIGPLKTNIGTYGAHNLGSPFDMVQKLALGEVDLAVTYSHPNLPLVLDSGEFVSAVVGEGRIVPVSAVDGDGCPLYRIDAGGAPLPLLAYATDSVLARFEGLAVQSLAAVQELEIRHQRTVVDVLKEMVLAGMGIAWLPDFCFRDESDQGVLAPIDGGDHSLDLAIRMYRKKDQVRPSVEKVWGYVEAREDRFAGPAVVAAA
ncbi:MAG: LysR family transcriptional regulator [Magnetovibrio sp.]|nr:LysR family transcriptional regulator [Magnetovibrio sp.]